MNKNPEIDELFYFPVIYEIVIYENGLFYILIGNNRYSGKENVVVINFEKNGTLSFSSVFFTNSKIIGQIFNPYSNSFLVLTSTKLIVLYLTSEGTPTTSNHEYNTDRHLISPTLGQYVNRGKGDYWLQISDSDSHSVAVFELSTKAANPSSPFPDESPTPTSTQDNNSSSNSAGSTVSITDWPWWAQAVFGTGVSAIGSVTLGTLGCFAKHIYNRYMHPDKPDMADRLYERLKRSSQRRRSDQPDNPRPPMPGPRSRVFLGFGPDGGSAINIEPMYVQPDGAEQNLPTYLEVVPSEAQPYQQPIAQYEEAMPQPLQQFGELNKEHQYEVIAPTTSKLHSAPLPSKHENNELEPIQQTEY